MKYKTLAVLCLPFLWSGCAAPMTAMTASESQLSIRQVQTREYEQVTVKQAMRASIATLQDLNFILDKVDGDLGMVSASKYRLGTNVKVTVTVREKGASLVMVRANATFGECTVEDPLIYQDFFSMLDKSLFLVTNKVD